VYVYTYVQLNVQLDVLLDVCNGYVCMDALAVYTCGWVGCVRVNAQYDMTVILYTYINMCNWMCNLMYCWMCAAHIQSRVQVLCLSCVCYNVFRVRDVVCVPGSVRCNVCCSACHMRDISKFCGCDT